MTRPSERGPVEQYGSSDLDAMTPDEIVQARTAGNLDDLLLRGVDRDAGRMLPASPSCSHPNTVRVDGYSESSTDPGSRLYRCGDCGTTNAPRPA